MLELGGRKGVWKSLPHGPLSAFQGEKGKRGIDGIDGMKVNLPLQCPAQPEDSGCCPGTPKTMLGPTAEGHVPHGTHVQGHLTGTAYSSTCSVCPTGRSWIPWATWLQRLTWI